MTNLKHDYHQLLNTLTHQIDAMVYELETFIPQQKNANASELRHDVFPIIRRLKEAKKLAEESEFY